MADPSLQSLCCVTTDNNSQQNQLLQLHQTPYYGLSLASAIVGFIGSVYQVLLIELVVDENSQPEVTCVICARLAAAASSLRRPVSSLSIL